MGTHKCITSTVKESDSTVLQGPLPHSACCSTQLRNHLEKGVNLEMVVFRITAFSIGMLMIL